MCGAGMEELSSFLMTTMMITALLSIGLSLIKVRLEGGRLHGSFHEQQTLLAPWPGAMDDCLDLTINIVTREGALNACPLL